MAAPDPTSAIIDFRIDPIGAARQGTNPTVLCRMRSGWAVIGNTQHLPGYCVLLYDGTADQLTDLPRPHRPSASPAHVRNRALAHLEGAL